MFIKISTSSLAKIVNKLTKNCTDWLEHKLLLLLLLLFRSYIFQFHQVRLELREHLFFSSHCNFTTLQVKPWLHVGSFTCRIYSLYTHKGPTLLYWLDVTEALSL